MALLRRGAREGMPGDSIQSVRAWDVDAGSVRCLVGSAQPEGRKGSTFDRDDGSSTGKRHGFRNTFVFDGGMYPQFGVIAMLIENLRLLKVGNKVRLTADCVYERAMRPFRSIYFEVASGQADWLTLSYHPFLLAAYLPAWRHGESRVRVEGDACPLLVANLGRIATWHAYWYKKKLPPPVIEFKPAAQLHDEKSRRTAMFFTGGVDSMFTFHDLRRSTPETHPASISAAIIVYGLEVRKAETFVAAVRNAVAFGERTAMEVVPVETNFPEMEDDYDFWMEEYAGTGFGAVAHALSGGAHTVYCASSFDLDKLRPWALHPFTDPLHSSSDLEIRHHGIDVRRFEKVRSIARFEAGVGHLRVCNKAPDGAINCGKCEKCLRTMIGLLVAGVLDRATTFPVREVTAEAVRATRIPSDAQWAFNQELLEPLARLGRDDLVAALLHNHAKMKKLEAWRADRGVKGWIRKQYRYLYG